MATSPSPNSQPSAVSPPQSSTPSTPPPRLSTRFSPPPSFQPEANSPSTMANSSVSPSTNSTAPPPSTQSPPAQQPVASPAPLVTPSPPPVSSSPPPASAPPPVPVSPPPIPSPTTNSPPPSSPNPPVNPQPTPTPSPSADSPPSPSSNPPSVSPPPHTDPPHPSQTPSQISPPSPSSQPSQTTTPPTDSPPQDSPPAPSSAPPSNATPPFFDPPPPLAPDSQPSPNSSARPVFPVSAPPPSGLSPPSLVPPSPSQVQVPPSGIPTVNNSIPNAPSGNGGIGTGVAVAIGAVLGFILLSVIGAAVWYTRKQKKKVAGMPTSLSSSPNTDSSLLKAHRSLADVESRTPSEYLYSPSEPGGLGNSRPWFTYEALVEATNGFSAENLLGEGGFGSVYKGYLPDGLEVAVKQLKIGGGQGEREFKAEVEIISRIHHRHLVSLAGYCISDNRRLLVYEFVPNNTLHFHLHGADRPVMTWETRVRVAAGAARGIAYLHEDCHPRIIHRDIKSANILLDNNFEARVSDFGLAKLAVDANSHVTTRVMGTFGYMAPEYASSGKLTEKSDVFSFGVVLLELITGRKPVDTSQPLGEESLVEWARPQLSDALATERFEDLVDPRLEKNYVNSEMFRVIEAAAACVRHSATKRPSMGQVVRAFDSLITADLSNGIRVGESAIYDSAEQSAEIRLFQRMAFGTQDYSTDFFSQGSWHS